VKKFGKPASPIAFLQGAMVLVPLSNYATLSIIHCQLSNPQFSLKKTPFSLKRSKKLGENSSPIAFLQ